MGNRSEERLWLPVVCLVAAAALGVHACGGKDKVATGGPSLITTTTSTTGSGGAAGSGGALGGGGASGGNGGAAGGAAGAGGTPAHCGNGQTDGDETDLDCGGSCDGCAINQHCLQGPDCLSLSCIGELCAAPSCVDSAQNGAETDVDCGGPNCPACINGQHCGGVSDCVSHVCVNGVCQIPSCNDGVKNGTETDIDCGGPCQNHCAIGKACVVAGDCIFQKCQQHMCQCPDGMQIIPASGGGAYCIDATEVTYERYNEFYSANPPIGSQIPECLAWNTDFTPEVGWPPLPTEVTLPVVGVNWCEAYEYCVWRGKRLCGQVGGGASAFAEYVNADLDQWFDACSAQGNYDYPYGDLYETHTCNGLDNLLAHTMKEDVATNCVGGALGLIHMSGNVREWEDSCDGSTGQTDHCRSRGGSFRSNMTDLRCDAPTNDTRDVAADDLGFRCCI